MGALFGKLLAAVRWAKLKLTFTRHHARWGAQECAAVARGVLWSAWCALQRLGRWRSAVFLHGNSSLVC